MSVNLQQQIRDNSRELNDYLRDLSDWTGDVKEKDQALRQGRLEVGTTATATELSPNQVDTQHPPVRGRVEAHRVKTEGDLRSARKSASSNTQTSAAATAASEGTEARVPHNSTAATDQRLKNDSPVDPAEVAAEEKNLGNACFKMGDYTAANAHYTRCLEYGGLCAAYANRAMCSIKLGWWTAAEADCTEALMLEPTYLKVRNLLLASFSILPLGRSFSVLVPSFTYRAATSVYVSPPFSRNWQCSTLNLEPETLNPKPYGTGTPASWCCTAKTWQTPAVNNGL
jgi:tetratricopeptide (TPR) repeat protein